MRRLSFIALALACAFAPWCQAQGALAAAPSERPYPGVVALHVDATDLDRRVFRVRQTLPVAPGPIRLYQPRWIPGHHAATGDATRLAGLVVRANGQRLAWQRDPSDIHSFLLDVPAGVTALDLEFQHLSPVDEGSGRVAMTRELANVQWHNLLLYPADRVATAITYRASLTLPDRWTWAGALRAARSDGANVHFQPVTLETLVDSPLFVGAHHKRIELDAAGAARPVMLHVFADSPAQLEASDAQIDAHRRLVQQADKLFASRHFAHYDFLLALSERLGGIGLEHHQSSENAVKPTYFKDWDKAVRSRELLAHEYVHSWNGKFRRPQGLVGPHFNLPMDNALLWLYEAQTEFWGKVLAARSGLVSETLARDELADLAAVYAARAGRAWRNLQDTTNDSPMSAAGARSTRDWNSWQRNRGDYYGEAVLVWLDADMLIREASAGVRSLDDFARLFFGLRDGDLGPLPYTFDDIVATLNAVQRHDWARFLRDRLDNHEQAPLDGLARAGWRLTFTDKASSNLEAGEGDGKYSDFYHSLGFNVGQDGRLSGVLWDGPAFRSGLAPGLTLIAVNQRAYKPDALKQAIRANRDGTAPIELLLRDSDRFFSVRIDYRDGVRYPALERIEGRPDGLTALLAPR
jgi:predicted metalloprotease with PDZ domain